MEIRNKLLLIFCFIVLGYSISGCDSKPIADLFEKDLKVNVVFKDTDDLLSDSVVYMEEDNERVNIGSVKEIEINKDANKVVHLAILYDYRDLMNTGTMFVLDSPFIGNEQTRILVANVARDSLATPLKSGATVNGSTWTDYNIALAKKGMSELMDDASVQAKKYLNEFNKYVESFDMDQFISQVQETTDAISKFSKEQKENFEKEVLPEIEKLIEDIEKKLEQSGDDEDMRKLEKEYEKLKDSVAI